MSDEGWGGEERAGPPREMVPDLSLVQVLGKVACPIFSSLFRITLMRIKRRDVVPGLFACPWDSILPTRVLEYASDRLCRQDSELHCTNCRC